MTFPRLLADLVCPVLGAGVLAAPLVCRPRPSPWRDWAQAVVAVGWVYGLAFADRQFGWWDAVGLDFSTHTGIALALAVVLGRRAGRLRPLLAVLLVGYAALMIALRYHSLLDIVTSAAAVAPVAFRGSLRRPAVVRAG